VEALATTIIEELRARLDSPAFQILAYDTESCKRRLRDEDVRVVKDLYGQQRILRLASAGAIGRRAMPYVSAAIREQWSAIEHADAVVASGGDMFSSDYGSPRRWLLSLDHAIRHRVPVVFLAQSVGPFREVAHREDFLRTARKAALLTVRESASYEYLVSDLRMSEEQVVLTADPAFLLPPPPEPVTDQILDYYGIRRDEPIVALSVSAGICRYAAGHEATHLQRLIELTEMLVGDWGAQVLLVPHAEDAMAWNNDLLLACDVSRACGRNRRVQVLACDHTAREFKGLIGRCDMVIAERMHAAIAGLSSGVCTCVVGYSVKARGILKDILGRDGREAGVMMPVEQVIAADATEVKEWLTCAWARRKEIAASVQANLEMCRSRAQLNFDLVARVIKDH
jgi:colanic acid/amylovoran biosynthesis protein